MLVLKCHFIKEDKIRYPLETLDRRKGPRMVNFAVKIGKCTAAATENELTCRLLWIWVWATDVAH